MGIASLMISGISLIVAIVSFIISRKSQFLQDRVNEIEIKLKEYELAEKEKEMHEVSNIEARINHIVKGQYKIKVWNSGNAVANNVTVSWDKNDGILFFDEEKLPFEFLEPQKSFDLSISTYSGSPRKLLITTRWEDSKGTEHSKEQWCDL